MRNPFLRNLEARSERQIAFTKEHVGDHAFELGAVTANIMLTFFGILVVILLSVVLTSPDVSVGWVVGSSAALALIAPAVFYPISFTLWQAIDLWMRPPTASELAGEGDARL